MIYNPLNRESFLVSLGDINQADSPAGEANFFVSVGSEKIGQRHF